MHVLSLQYFFFIHFVNILFRPFLEAPILIHMVGQFRPIMAPLKMDLSVVLVTGYGNS